MGHMTAATTGVILTSGNTVFNEASADKDFRIESDGNTHMLFVDAGNNKVGIGGTPTGEFHTFSAAAGDNVIIETTVANSTTSAPNIVLYRNGATAENNDLIGQIVFRGKNTAGSPQDVDYATIESGIDDVTDGGEDGHMTFNLIEAGTLTEFMRIRAATRDVVVNDQADDIDFRVEGSSNQNMLFVDASADAVGIGTGTPDTNSALTVEGAVSLDEISAPTNTADRGQLYTNADNELHMIDGAGTDVVFRKSGKHTIWVPAAAMYPNTTNGCAALAQVELSNGPELKVLDFDDGSDEFAQFTIAFPKSWNEGTITFQPFWTISATGTNTVAWQLQAVAFADNADQNTTFGTAIATVAKAHSGTSGDLMVSAESGAVTIKNAAVDTVTYFQINRDTSADNHASDARLVGVKIFYTVDAGNDA